MTLPAVALSIRQPWMWAILEKGKRVENRVWRPVYRGSLLLHAAKGCTGPEVLVALDSIRAGGLSSPNDWPGLESVPRGGICGVADLVHVYEKDEIGVPEHSPWRVRGCYGLVLENVRPLPFVATPGALGLFAVRQVVLDQIEIAVGNEGARG